MADRRDDDFVEFIDPKKKQPVFGNKRRDKVMLPYEGPSSITLHQSLDRNSQSGTACCGRCGKDGYQVPDLPCLPPSPALLPVLQPARDYTLEDEYQSMGFEAPVYRLLPFREDPQYGSVWKTSHPPPSSFSQAWETGSHPKTRSKLDKPLVAGSGQEIGRGIPGIVNAKEFIVTKAERQEMLVVIRNGTNLVRGRKSQDSSDHTSTAEAQMNEAPMTEVQMRKVEDELDRVCRWNTLLTNTGINAGDIIQWVTQGNVSPESKYYVKLRSSMLEQARIYKAETLDRYFTLVGHLLEQDPSLEDVSPSKFMTKFRSTFSPRNFMHCHSYMQAYMNFVECSDLARWFMESLYVNIGCMVHRGLFIESDKARAKFRKNILLPFYDCIALFIHDEIDISDFQQLSERFRVKKDERDAIFQAIEDNVVDIGPPPKRFPLGATLSDFVTDFGPRADTDIAGYGRGNEDAAATHHRFADNEDEGTYERSIGDRHDTDEATASLSSWYDGTLSPTPPSQPELVGTGVPPIIAESRRRKPTRGRRDFEIFPNRENPGFDLFA